VIFKGKSKGSGYEYIGNIDGYLCFKTLGGNHDFKAKK
jgi:hypothetical protein